MALWVDGSYKTSNPKVVGFTESNSTYITTIIVPNLTPGTHTIELRMSKPGVPGIKKSSINVIVPRN